MFGIALFALYWFGVLGMGLIAVFVYSLFFFSGKHQRMRQKAYDSCRTRDGGESAAFFSSFGVVLAIPAVAFASIFGLPVYAVIGLAWLLTRADARETRVVNSMTTKRGYNDY